MMDNNYDDLGFQLRLNNGTVLWSLCVNGIYVNAEFCKSKFAGKKTLNKHEKPLKHKSTHVFFLLCLTM